MSAKPTYRIDLARGILVQYRRKEIPTAFALYSVSNHDVWSR
jgi:hypothetical protein